MTTQQKKEKLINQIQEIDDAEMIQHLLNLIESEVEQKKREPYKLTEMEEKAIEVAERDIETNNLLSEEEADKKIKKWL